MGVGAGLATGGALVALGAAVLGPLVLGSARPASPAAVAGLTVAALAMVVGGRRWPQLAAGFAGVGLAPIFVDALLRAGPVGGVVLAAAVVMVAVGRGALPRPLPAALVLVGLVEAVRAGAASQTLVPAAATAAPLVLAGLGAGAACSVPARPRLLGGALGLAALLLAAGRARPGDGSVADAVARAQAGLPASPPPGLADQLAYIAARPGDHDVALPLVTTHGAALPLEAGWRPQGARLSPDDRVATAAWLDARGRGGEGRRLLAAGRTDPGVAWWWWLARRGEGLSDPVALPADPPAQALALPGDAPLTESLLSNTTRAWLLHVDAPCRLRLEAEGEAFDGPPVLTLEVDAGPPQRWAVPGGPARLDLGRLAPGPHRLRLRFGNDASGPEGDRNVHLHGLACDAG